MSLSLINSTYSFVRFNQAQQSPLCIWGLVNYCLPVYNQEDVYFQFVIEGLEDEIDSLCTQSGDEIQVDLVEDCEGAVLLAFSEKPERFRLSATQVLYNWTHGFPNFASVVAVNSCFKVLITITSTPYGYPEEVDTFCSNCFERIPDDCYTSVVEYGNDEDGFGFKYCYGGGIEGDGSGGSSLDCEPTIVPFVSLSTLSIPYTSLLQSKYGVFPTVQVWIYDGTGALVNMNITAGFDTYPPTMINLDFGGQASGIVIIR